MSGRADEATGSRLQAGLKEVGARLALTSEREARVRSIFEEYLKAQTATLDRYDTGTDDRGSAIDIQRMRTLREELRANSVKVESRLSDVLSEIQMAEFERIRDEQEEKLRERLLSRRLEEIGARLGLTSEQTDRVRPVLKEHFEAQMAILDEHGIALGDRDGHKRPGFRTLRRVRRDLSENNARTEKRLSAFLTEAQTEAYEALQAEQRDKMRALLALQASPTRHAIAASCTVRLPLARIRPPGVGWSVRGSPRHPVITPPAFSTTGTSAQ